MGWVCWLLEIQVKLVRCGQIFGEKEHDSLAASCAPKQKAWRWRWVPRQVGSHRQRGVRVTNSPLRHLPEVRGLGTMSYNRLCVESLQWITISVIVFSFYVFSRFGASLWVSFFKLKFFLRQKMGFHFCSYVPKPVLQFLYFVSQTFARIPTLLHLSHLKALTPETKLLGKRVGIFLDVALTAVSASISGSPC